MSNSDKAVIGLAFVGLVLVPTATIITSILIDGAIAFGLFMYFTKWRKKDGEND